MRELLVALARLGRFEKGGLYMYEEVKLNNAVFDLRNPQEISMARAGAREKTSPYTWIWEVKILDNGDSVVSLTEFNRVNRSRDTAVIAEFTAEQIIRALQTKWNRPIFAHCTAEGKLARHIDELQSRLRSLYAEEYDGMLFGVHSGQIPANRVIDPSEGLLSSHIVKNKKKVTVVTAPTGRHADIVREIAWCETLRACFKQGNQYDLPYGGRVFDIAEMLRRATRDI